MLRTSACLVAALFLVGTLSATSAQTPAPTAKPSKVRLTIEHLKEMRAKWKANKPKLVACRKEAKTKDMVGDDRWFFIEDCMQKT